jgi:3-oxoacyl-[acyl-carrier-protein] synthase-3
MLTLRVIMSLMSPSVFQKTISKEFLMEAYIKAVGAYVPEKIMSNDELSTFVDTSDEWIYSHTGIKNRRIAKEEEAASDLGLAAALDALKKITLKDADANTIEGSEIDLILLATSTPDYPGLPSTACVVQDKLGADKCGAMDLVAACTGFVYALETAKNYIVTESAKNILVIGTEVYSKIVNWKDRGSCVLFGDGAGAVLVTATPTGKSGKIMKSVLGSRGSGVDSLLRKAGGSRNKFIPGTTPEEDLYLYMDGRKVYLFAVQAIIQTIEELLEKNNLTIDEIDYVVPHQANKRIIEAACKRKNWPEEKFFMNIDKYANTSAASIPIALEEMQAEGMLKEGMTILTVGFGSGLTFGGNVFIW